MSGLPAKGEKDDEDLQLVDKLVTLGLGVCAFCVTPTLRMCCTKKPLLRESRNVKNVVCMCHAITRFGAVVGIVLPVVPCSP